MQNFLNQIYSSSTVGNKINRCSHHLILKKLFNALCTKNQKRKLISCYGKTVWKKKISKKQIDAPLSDFLQKFLTIRCVHRNADMHSQSSLKFLSNLECISILRKIRRIQKKGIGFLTDWTFQSFFFVFDC